MKTIESALVQNKLQDLYDSLIDASNHAYSNSKEFTSTIKDQWAERSKAMEHSSTLVMAAAAGLGISLESSVTDREKTIDEMFPALVETELIYHEI